MKVGDKMVCIKDYYDYFVKNNIYMITGIESGIYYYFGPLWFTLIEDSIFCINDYFITLDEYRESKLKLILNEER